MGKLSKTFNFALITGILGAVVMTFMAPRVITLLFTPPVSFGTNCEPAAAWSMGKLMASQSFGLLAGMFLSFGWSTYRALQRRGLEPKDPLGNLSGQSTHNPSAPSH